MLSFHGRWCGTGRGPKLFENLHRGSALLKVVLEKLGDYLAARIDQVSSRIRDAIGHRVRWNGFVQNPESANDFGIGIRKQKISNMLSVRKVLELGHAVIADRRQPQALFTDIAEMLFQLDELGFAEWSPVRRAVKDQQRAFRAKNGLQVLQSTVLIRRLKRRYSCADFRAGFDCLLR